MLKIIPFYVQTSVSTLFSNTWQHLCLFDKNVLEINETLHWKDKSLC